ncbi:MAG: hypothetical protein ACI8TP_000296 [Acidimicrobiales bacterium]|jgi:hypothetical protein
MSDNTSAHNKNDQNIVEKVQALLRKAESTEFPQEAEACMAKAQELITHYAIDVDVLAAGSAPNPMSHEEISIEGRYGYERALVWTMVARANRSRVLLSKTYGTRKVSKITLIGRAIDRELVKLLALSLEHQALRGLPQAGPNDRGSLVRVRRSYLYGFAVQVGERLTEAVNVADPTGLSAERSLVLADELEMYMESAFGPVSTDNSKVTLDPGAYDEGSAAASSADLGQARIRRDDRRALGAG